MRDQPLLEGCKEITCKIIVTEILRINQKMLNKAAQKRQLLIFFVRDFSKELFSKFEGYKGSTECALIEVYSKTDFSRSSHCEETSNFICIENHLIGFRIIRVSTERNF